MLTKIAIENVGPMADVEFAVDRRLNVFTGDNGLGKSLILDIAFWAQCGLWPRMRAAPDPRQQRVARIAWSVRGGDGEAVEREARYDATRERWRRRTLGGDKPDRRPVIVYAMVDGGFAVFDQARAGGTLHEEDADARIPVASRGRGYFVFTADEVFDGLSGADGFASNGLIRDWPDWQYRHRRRFQALKSALTTLSEGIGEPIRIARPQRIAASDSREIPWIGLPYGQIPITQASAAVRRIAALAYMLVWAWSEHEQACRLTKLPLSKQLMILIDEVECHLHPKWQRTILPAVMAAVRELAAKASAQLLATTHSPLVLASLEPIFEEGQDQLHLIDLGKRREVRVQPINFAPMGRADTWLTSESFGLRQPMSVPAEVAVMQARAMIRAPKPPTPKVLQHAIKALSSVVAETDPLLARLVDLRDSRAVQSGRKRSTAR